MSNPLTLTPYQQSRWQQLTRLRRAMEKQHDEFNNEGLILLAWAIRFLEGEVSDD